MGVRTVTEVDPGVVMVVVVVVVVVVVDDDVLVREVEVDAAEAGA